MSRVRHLIFTILLLGLTTSCYTPASSNWYSYAGNFCDRKTLYDRACSVGFFIVTLPVYMGAIVVDVPFALIEFFIGWAPFKDPGLAALDGNQLPQHHLDAQGQLWVVDRHPENPDELLILKEKDGLVLDAYRAQRLDGKLLRIAKADCSDIAGMGSCKE